MIKLIAMIGAVAMSFGLFAASPAPFSISFEATESGKGISDGAFNPKAEGVPGWTWTGDPFALSQYAGEVLPYDESGDKARRNDQFVGLDTNENYLPLSTGSDELTLAVSEGNLYLDQLVKFTGFEDPQTNLVAGTKIAVWMSEFEKDDESTETNLYVTVGKLTNGEVKQIALKVDGGPYSLDTWYRLTVKSLGNIYTEGASTVAAGFLVYVNGQQVASSDDAALDLTDKVGEMTDAAKEYMKNKQLFTSIAADATFTSVGYQGIGAIDDIIVDAKGPDFCVETVETVDVTFADITGAVITKVVDSDGTVFTDFTSAISVKPGKLTVTLAAAEGYKMTSSGEYIVDVSAAGQLKVTVAKGDFVEVYATKVNGETTTEYGAAELLTMINNLVNGDVVTFNLGSTITNTVEGAEVTLYSFTADTTITVSVDNGVTTWTIASATAEDLITDNCGVAENFRKVYKLIDENSSVVFAGEVAGTFKAAYLSNGDAPITLSGEGKVITMSEVDVYDGDNNLVEPTADVPDAGWYTYALSDVPPETYDITFATVENGTLETSVTNGIAAGTTVTVIATPATGYECTQITTNGSAITGPSFEMPAYDVEIGATFTLQQFTVAAISVANASVVATNKTAGGATFALPADLLRDTEIAVTVTPNANYEYATTPAGWTKNGDGSITTNATVTANLTITVEAPTAAITPVEPETPKNYDSKEAADAAAAAINANKETMIKTPDGADAADYTALFTAVVKANNEVVVELNEGGTNALKAAATTIEKAVAGKLDDIAAAAAGGNVEVVVTGVEPGFWYGVGATADLTTMGASQPGEFMLATSEGVSLTVTKPETGNAAFFQTRVKVK